MNFIFTCSKWFDRDGTLRTVENPQVNFSLRPSTKSLELTEYCAAPTIQCEGIIVDQNRILNLQILSLTLKHHPLFSAEHVLQQKLVAFYDIYQEFSSQNRLERLFNRLEALRCTKERSKQQAGDVENTNIIKEIVKLRERLFEEGKVERESLKGILQTWKAIKKLRESNGFSNTSIKVTIRKENVDMSQEKLFFEKQIKQAIVETLEEHNKKFQKEIKIYKNNLLVWKNAKNADKEKPRKPQKNYSDIEIKQEITKKFEESFKPPGEPKLHFEICYDNEITSDVQDAKERLRRSCVNTTKLWLKIFCNDLEVCRTKRILLNDRFVCVFEETFSIQLKCKTPRVVLEVIEQPGTLLKRRYGEIDLTLPRENENNVLREEHFTTEEIVQYNKHCGVGSGVTFSGIFPDLNLPDTILNTSGFLLYDTFWDFEIKPNNQIIRNNSIHCFNEIFYENGTINIEKLIEWSQDRDLDPEDPRNAILYDFVKTYSEQYSESRKKFYR